MPGARSADYVIGIDIGTQGVRGMAVASNGTVVAHASVPWADTSAVGTINRALRPSSDKAFEQDAEEWWRATCSVLRQIGEQLVAADVASDAVKALCVAGTSGTVVPLNSFYRPLRPALIYSDSRAVAEADRCNSVLSDLTSKLGYRFNASFALPKLLWLCEHEPEIWAKTALIAHQVDYIVGRLTNVWGVAITPTLSRSAMICSQSAIH